MAKADITTAKLLAWDTFKGKTVDVALPSIYDHASGTSRKICDWYWHSIKVKRQASQWVRFITFALLAVGTVFPILAGLCNDTTDRLQFTQLGVVALAIGGLLQVADRVFGWSSGWLRYVTTVTAMENLTRKFELDWAGNLVSKTGALDETDTKKQFDLAKQFEDDIVKLQSDETDKWATEFNTGTALLGDLIKSQRESAEKAVEAAHTAIAAQQASDKAKQNGAIELTLIHKAEVKPVTITMDDKPLGEFTGTVWSNANVPPGLHTISVVTNGAAPETIKKIAEVSSGSVSRIEIKFA